MLRRAGRYQEAFLLDANAEIISRDVNRALKAIQCGADQPSGKLPKGYNATVMAVQRAFAQKVQQRQAEQHASVGLTAAQKYVLHELRLLFNAAETPEKRDQVQLLEESFRQAGTRALRNELNRLRRNGVRGEVLFKRLIDLYYQHNLKERSVRQTMQSERDLLPIIVCSEAL